MSSKVQEFMALLEAERIDNTWRTVVPPFRYQPTEPIVKTKVVQVPVSLKSQKRRDRIFFNLGRYESGARDQDAIWGKIESDKLWKKENK